MKLEQGVDGLLGFDVGSWHPEKMARAAFKCLVAFAP
jgi:hypothetical protein